VDVNAEDDDDTIEAHTRPSLRQCHVITSFPFKVVSPWNATRVRDHIDDLRHDILRDSDGDDGEEVLIDCRVRLLKCKSDVRSTTRRGDPAGLFWEALGGQTWLDTRPQRYLRRHPGRHDCLDS
jgi:hypothetical protein